MKEDNQENAIKIGFTKGGGVSAKGHNRRVSLEPLSNGGTVVHFTIIDGKHVDRSYSNSLKGMGTRTSLCLSEDAVELLNTAMHYYKLAETMKVEKELSGEEFDVSELISLLTGR